jgi:hypothetical protein
MAYPKQDPDRWRALVDVRGADECWPWTSKTAGRRGEGRVYIDGHLLIVARIVLAEKIGRALVPGEMATHSCDYPPCCNPRHIHLGNATTNNREREARKRGRYGDVRAREERIMELIASGLTYDQVAARVGMKSKHCVFSAVKRVRARRLDPTAPLPAAGLV